MIKVKKTREIKQALFKLKIIIFIKNQSFFKLLDSNC